METLFYYALVILAYIPGLVGLVRFKFYGKFPLILFCFIGMFFGHALGSIFVMLRDTPTGVSLFSHEFVIMLIAEVLIFYLITWPYLFYRRNVEYYFREKTGDYIIIPILLFLIGLILLIYRMNVGTFLVSDLLSQYINQHTVGSYRMEKSYGLAEFGFYSFGFIVLPAILAAHTFFMALSKQRFSLFNLLIIFLCSIPNILLGEKSGVLRVVIILCITYIIYLGMNNKPPIKILNWKSALLFTVTLIPTIIAYLLYIGLEKGGWYVIKKFFYRIFISYSETLAAAVPMAGELGFFGGNTLPKLGGLIADPRNHVPINGQMHYYLFGGAGAAPVAAVGEGYLNYGWPGFIFFAVLFFITVIILQELFARIQLSLFSCALMAWFAYLSLYTNLLGIFATLLLPQYYLIFLLAVFVWMIDYLFLGIPIKPVADS